MRLQHDRGEPHMVSSRQKRPLQPARVGFAIVGGIAVVIVAASIIKRPRTATIVSDGSAVPKTSALPSSPSEPRASYPPGRWRLAPTELERVMLTVSQIQIRFRGAEEPTNILQRRAHWSGVARDEPAARSLIHELSAHLRRDHGAFHELARKHSDDLATATFGGALGTFLAVHAPAEVLDAVQTLHPGEVSLPVRLPSGYYLFKREHTPVAQSIAWRVITLTHQGADPAALKDGSRSVERPYKEARALAQDLRRELKARPDAFAELARKFSDSLSSSSGGEMGLWSTHSPNRYSVEFSILSKLPIGGVSEPVDSSDGVRLLMRIAPESYHRERFSIRMIRFPYDTSAPVDAPSGERVAMQRGRRALAELLQGKPFDAVRGKACCKDPIEWTGGRNLAAIEAAVRTLRSGQFFAKPVRAGGAVFIVQRIEPRGDGAFSPLFDLPNPQRPEVDFIVRTVPGRALASVIRVIGDEAAEHIELGADKQVKFRELHAQLATHLEHAAEPSERQKAVSATFARLKNLVADGAFAKYQGLVDRHAEKALFQRPAP
jgi:hypothetical protein